MDWRGLIKKVYGCVDRQCKPEFELVNADDGQEVRVKLTPTENKLK